MGCSVIFVNGGDYTFDNTVRTPIYHHHQWDTSPCLQSQGSQVARSQIKHADEHGPVKSDPRLRGVSVQLSLYCTDDATSSLCSPPLCLLLMVQSQTVNAPSLHPSRCESATFGNRQMSREGHFSRSPERGGCRATVTKVVQVHRSKSNSYTDLCIMRLMQQHWKRIPHNKNSL